MQMPGAKQKTTGVVFYVSVVISALIVLWGVVSPSSFDSVTTRLFEFTVSNLSWFFLLAANLVLVFVIYLALSKHGKIKFGKEGDTPEFGRPSWFAMMFQAGMGPAIIF